MGRHGIVLEFADPSSGERRSATYLPYVAQDEGWSVSHTVRLEIWAVGCCPTIIAGRPPDTAAGAQRGLQRRPTSYKPSTRLPTPDPKPDPSHPLTQVESLARKAGYNGPVTGDLRSAMRVTRYQCSAFALSYREHVDWRAATGPGGQQRVVTVAA